MKIFISLTLCISFACAIVDVNHASIDELKHLKGVCKTKAKNIQTHIQYFGCFDDIDELEYVDGIDEGIISINKNDILLIPCHQKVNDIHN